MRGTDLAGLVKNENPFFTIQIKLIDVETYVTVNAVSAKFTQGNEDEFLNRISDLAKKLSSRQ